MQKDSSRHISMCPLLRKPLRDLFGDKLSAEGTTVNNGGVTGMAIEDVLADLEKTGGHVGRNYAAFIRKKIETGLKPNVDYVRCGYDLSTGKSLLFNTPFYDKLNPYLFYAMNRELLTGGKVLIVLGRHGTEEDLLQWSAAGMKGVSNVPDLWKIAVLTGKKTHEDDLPDIWQYTHWDNNQNFQKCTDGKRVLIYEGMAKWAEIQYLYLIGETQAAMREEQITRNRQDAYGIGFRLYEDFYPLAREAMSCEDTPFTPNRYPFA